MKTKRILSLLALSSLFFAMLLPPEAYPNGKLAVVLCATFSFAGALSERRIPYSFLKAGMWLFGLLLVHTFAISVDLYRSLDTLTAIWAYYCLIGFFIYANDGLEKNVAGTIVVLSLIVSGYGVYQYFWGFDKVYQYIFYSSSDQIVKTPALDIVASRRVFSTLALPGTLWGFLVCALPFHAMLWRTSRRAFDMVLALSATMLLITGFLTRSFGFLLGLFVLVVAGVLLRYRRFVWNRVTPVAVLLVIAGTLFYSARRGVIEGSDPVGLRFKNWVSAWNVFESRPLGTGLNTFGVVYPEYMQPEANETQYVHNTFLQLLSELGYPLIFALILVLVIHADKLTNVFRSTKPATFWLLLAVAVWIAHNMVDIDVYFPSVGVLGAVLIGTLFAREYGQFPAAPKTSLVITGVFAALMVVFSGMACISSELQNRAQIEYDNKKLPAAIQTLQTARSICPINSSLYHDAGNILLELFQKTHQQDLLTQATALFHRAVLLSPEKVGSRIGYGLCLSSANRMPEALDQIHIAQRLYPSSAYAQSIAQLMERRIQ
jgi:O-Antigen ligase